MCTVFISCLFTKNYLHTQTLYTYKYIFISHKNQLFSFQKCLTKIIFNLKKNVFMLTWNSNRFIPGLLCSSFLSWNHRIDISRYARQRQLRGGDWGKSPFPGKLRGRLPPLDGNLQECPPFEKNSIIFFLSTHNWHEFEIQTLGWTFSPGKFKL